MKALAADEIISQAVLGTPLRLTTYAGLIADCQQLARRPGVWAVDFSNTHIVTLRRHDAAFRELTGCFDFFIPDGTPLVWCLNARGARLADRVYGPIFMKECVLTSPAPCAHYFLGGSVACVNKLQALFRAQNPAVCIVGVQDGYFPESRTAAIVEEINRLSPDFIWVGLGTPKQQSWINQNKSRLKRGVIFAVGFAFDVNAGTKPDAPLWMQRAGLTWLFRLAAEPRRLAWRYLKHNSLFLFYLLWDGVRGRAFRAFDEG